MITRRGMMTTAIGGAALLTTTAHAQSWKEKYPELTFAVIPAENASGVSDRFGPFLNYLSKELGTKVTLRIAQDYAAVIEGQRAGNVHIANHGPASFARARLTGVKADAVVIEVNSDGSKGYYSVFYTLAKSPLSKIEETKGKVLGLVDPNSTSGNNMPRFKLNALGINPETYYSKVIYTGSHENALLALAQGTIDVAANWWNSEEDSNLTRMLNKGLLKSSDGKPMTKDDFRIIVKSDIIINSPVAVLSDLPADLKTAIKKAFLEAAEKDRAAFEKLSDGKNKPYQDVKNEDYDKTIELIKFVDSLRKA